MADSSSDGVLELPSGADATASSGEAGNGATSDSAVPVQQDEECAAGSRGKAGGSGEATTMRTREKKKTPRDPVAKPAATAAAGQLLCKPNVSKNTSQVPADKTKPVKALRQLLCDHKKVKKTRPAPSTKLPAGQCQCHHRGTEEMPQWRQGPDGPRTLCNACGVRYRAGCLVPEYRPLNNPSFSPELYSNIRRRRVAQMCRRHKESVETCQAANGDE
jgi:hypothetical protein